MFEALGAKVLSGIISLSMFLFSSYTGNDPSLKQLSGSMNGSSFHVHTTLENAFTNDFPDVFKSGVTIPIYFNVQVKNGKTIHYNRTHRTSVFFDPMDGVYLVQQTGNGSSNSYSSYRTMIQAISAFECSIPVDGNWGSVNVSIEAYLSTVHFKQINRKVDLMVLWKYNRPQISGTFTLKRVY